jgi:hypothetical protein
MPMGTMSSWDRACPDERNVRIVELEKALLDANDWAALIRGVMCHECESILAEVVANKLAPRDTGV